MNRFLSRAVALLGAALTATLVACGGGGGSAGTDTSGGAVYQGTISGFGSVIVNGVRFDDGAASVQIDDDSADRSALKLGMRGEVSGSVSDDGTQGSASSIVVETAVRGPISAVNAAAGSFVIRGITVSTDTTTVFEGAGSLAALQVGQWVEVHGSVDFAARTVQATRVEVKAPEDIGRIVLFGKATAVTATQFTLGDLTIDTSAARMIGFNGAAVSEGAVVRVRASQPPVGNVLQASVVKAVKAPRLLDGTPAAVEGRIQQFKSVSDFLVSGTAVDATNATFQNGVAADLAEGKRVVVQGTLANGKLIAKKLRFFRPDQDGEIRLIGMVSDFVSVSSFKVRGVAVDASAARFDGGTATELMNGRLVEIKGAAAGSVVQATEVKFGDATLTSGLLTGVVSDFVSTAQFKVGGRDVRLGVNARLVNGTAADIVNGATLWMRGQADSVGVYVVYLVVFPPRWIVATTQVAGTVADVAIDGSFMLNGTRVTTSGVTRFLGGNANQMVAGGWVVVTGRVSGGVLAADTIVFTAKSSNDNCKVFKIEGVVYDFASISGFKLLGFSVDASGAKIEGGVAADIANGQVVEACGNELPTAGVLKALKLEIKAPR
jgi:hypothetical protein